MRILHYIAPLIFIVAAFITCTVGDVLIFTSEEKLEQYIASNPLTLVLYKVNNNAPFLFESASSFFRSEDWGLFVSAIEKQDFTTASTIMDSLKMSELGLVLGPLIDKLLESIRSNPKFINLVKNIAIVDCEVTFDSCTNRIEEMDFSKMGIIVQL